MRFYDISGKQFSTIEFVDYYCKEYFLSNNADKRLVKRLNRSSCFVEEQICSILYNGIKEPTDVIKILAWKVGKIKHKESELKRKIIYTKDWKDAEVTFKIMRYKESVDLTPMVEYITENYDSLHQQSIEEPQIALNNLKKIPAHGIGTVYLLTLLFFISKGEHPIYDRFAMKALIAADKGYRPNEVSITTKELPPKGSNAFDSLMRNEIIKKYTYLLNDFFGVDYKTNRDIDRALWVYGHLFDNITSIN